MRVGIYVSHPEVDIDPQIEVPRWGLSEVGRARTVDFSKRVALGHDVPVFSSTECKAIQLADLMQPNKAVRFDVDQMGENDRSATGFLKPPEFEDHVEQFFAHPKRSFRGWETAQNAQSRIVHATKQAIVTTTADKIIFCGHGGVGTLLKCALGDRQISQSQDQRLMGNAGGGNCFAFDLDRMALLCDWTPMEQFEGYL